MVALAAMVFLFIFGTMLVFFLATFIPFLILAIRRMIRPRSRAAKVWMIVLGSLSGLTAMAFLGLIGFIALANSG